MLFEIILWALKKEKKHLKLYERMLLKQFYAKNKLAGSYWIFTGDIEVFSVIDYFLIFRS